MSTIRLDRHQPGDAPLLAGPETARGAPEAPQPAPFARSRSGFASAMAICPVIGAHDNAECGRFVHRGHAALQSSGWSPIALLAMASTEPRNSVRAPRRRGSRHAQPAEGAQRRHARHGAGARPRSCTNGPTIRRSRGSWFRRRASARSRAGGDIRALYDLGRAGRHADMLPFWREEYTLNALIKRYPKPYVALIDGIVMGGGVGLSVHGSHRVAGDRYLFAMPEVGIGFFPGCRRDLVPAAAAGRARRLLRADRRAARRRRWRCRVARHPSRAVGALCRAARRAVRRGLGRCAAGGVCGAGRRGAGASRRAPRSTGCLAAERVEDILAALDREARSGERGCRFRRRGRRHDPRPSRQPA